MNKDDTIEVEGIVEQALPNSLFKVLVQGNSVLAHISGKIRIHKIRINEGDRVLLAITVYDTSKGRIIRRL